jgi:predicted nucleic acid-binding protein
MARYLLDTSAINRICNGTASADAWSPFYITDLVLLKLSRMPDSGRREKLLGVLRGRLEPGGIMRSEGPATSQHDQVDDFDKPYDTQMFSLGQPFPRIMSSIGISHQQHWRDAFIMQAAMNHDLTLVTADKNQAKGARRCHVNVELID